MGLADDEKLRQIVRNMSDDQLRFLRSVTHEELEHRFLERVSKFPASIELHQEEINCLLRADKIGAIRHYWKRNSCSLAHAKKAVEDHMRKIVQQKVIS